MVGLRGIANWVVEHELWLLVIAVPLLMFPEVLPPLLTGAGIVLVLIPWLCRWLAKGYLSMRTPMDMPILGLFIMLPVSLWASVDFNLSLPKLTGIILGIVIFYAIANNVRTERDIWITTEVFILIGMGVSLLSLIGTDWTSKYPFLTPVYRYLPRLINNIPHSAGGGFHPNEVGGTLILFIPIVVSLLLHPRGREYNSLIRIGQGEYGFTHLVATASSKILVHLSSVWFKILALFLLSFTLFLTQSRSAFLGIIIALLTLSAIKNRWLRLVFIATIIGSVAVIWYFGIEAIGHFLLDVSESAVGVGTLKFAGRKEVWQRAIYMIQDFPYTGIGLNTFDPVAHVMYPFFIISPEARVIHAHNNFLQVAVDLGIPGLVAYSGLLTTFSILAWRIHRRSECESSRALAIGLFCGMIAQQVYGLTDAITLGAKPGAALWGMMGLMAALYQWEEAGGKN